MLGEVEQLVLLALLQVPDDGFGVSVQREIENRTGRRASLGAVYAALVRLEEKGFLVSRLGEATPQRGGRRKKLYRVTAPGRRALASSIAALRQLSEGLSPAFEVR